MTRFAMIGAIAVLALGSATGASARPSVHCAPDCYNDHGRAIAGCKTKSSQNKCVQRAQQGLNQCLRACHRK